MVRRNTCVRVVYEHMSVGGGRADVVLVILTVHCKLSRHRRNSDLSDIHFSFLVDRLREWSDPRQHRFVLQH